MSLSKYFPAQGGLPDVPRWAVISGLTAGALLTTSAVLWYQQPAPLVNFKVKLTLQKAGFHVRSVQGASQTYSYAERGTLRSDQPSLVFVSGYSGCKEDWLLLSQGIQSDLHVILLDLPGQGQASVPTDPADASLYRVTDMLAEFIQLTDLEAAPCHLVGVSMGASIVALYAAKYPRTVQRATLMCPAMQCPIETEAWQEVSVGAKVSEGKSDLVSLGDRAFYNVETKQHILWKHRIHQQADRAKKAFHKHVRAQQFQELTEEGQFEEKLSTVQVPVQIIWGEDDEVIHFSGASLLEEIIPSVKRLDIMEQCGHVIHLEKPDQARALVMDFYNTTYSS